MESDFISLAVIAIVAALVPLAANRIPNKLVPETVLLLIAGALLGPHALAVVNVTDAVSLLSEMGMAFLSPYVDIISSKVYNKYNIFVKFLVTLHKLHLH